MNEHRFTENETGVEVVIVPYGRWDPYPVYVSITYPSGRKFAMPDDEVAKYFTIVSPQNIMLDAFGGVDDRPTPNQKKLAASGGPCP